MSAHFLLIGALQTGNFVCRLSTGLIFLKKYGNHRISENTDIGAINTIIYCNAIFARPKNIDTR